MPDKQPDRRELILQAVIDLVASQGPNGVTLREVAARAQVSLGLVNYHYKTRSELFRATLDWILERISQIQMEVWQTAETDQDKLASFFVCQEKLLLEHSELLTAWLTFVTLGRTDPWVAARVQEHYVERIEMARSFLKQAMAQGTIRPDLRPGLTAEDLTAWVEGMGLLWLNRLDKKGIAAHRHRAVRRWMKILGLQTR